MNDDDIAYYFYRPVVQEETCSLGKTHRTTTWISYHVRLKDGSEREVSQREFDARPR